MIAPAPTIPGLRVVIPGVPVAQGRGRAFRCAAGVRVVDPAKSRSWKGVAAVVYQAAMGGRTPFEDALNVEIVAVFPRPKSLPKSAGVGRLPRPSRPDCDNLAKGACDAGNGILWADDAQIVRLTVSKWYAAVGEPPCVEVQLIRAAGEGT